MSRVAGVEARIAWAEQHVDKVDRALAAFLKLNPYEIRAEIDPHSGDQVLRLRHLVPVPGDLSLLIGDALFNIRSSLDHLAWRLVEANGGTPSRSTEFPVCESKARYESVANGRRIHGISDAAVRVLDGLQPYQGGNGLFWVLREAHNCDKHRHLLGANIARDRMNIRKRGGKSAFVSKWIDPTVPIEDGHEIGRLLAPFDDSDDLHVEVAFQVSFVQPLAVRGQPVVALLRQLLGLTNQTVDQFRPLLV